MKVECKLQRQGGTLIELDGVSYHFQPDSQGRHVAEVENEDHLGLLLSIHEAYRLAPRAEATSATADGDKPAETGRKKAKPGAVEKTGEGGEDAAGADAGAEDKAD
ncbi:hypothetical protein CEK28_08450 [Xenophilus sp. AP218F]|nr:hypothetical protein CEK28_08450 [Xenophilus sp. AP218F]